MMFPGDLGQAFEDLRDRAVSLFRIVFAVYRQIKAKGLDYRAMSLVYTSLLALIPLLAVSFSVLKAFGADSYLEPMLMELLKPLSDNTESVAAYLLDSVKQLRVGLLGSIGLLTLLYTSVSLLDKIEESFNHIWGKRARVSRSPVRRFSDYLTFILVGPLLVFTAFGGISEIYQRVQKFQYFPGRIGFFVEYFQDVFPYLFIVAAFALVYRIIPEAPVKTRSALVGGLVAGLSWKLVGWIFASFMAGSAQYHAVYSTFAILVLFMIWLYMSWLIVLLGVQVTFFHQYPRYLFISPGQIRLSARLFERLGLLAMVLVGRRFFHGRSPWSAREFAERLELPEECIDDLLSILVGKGFLMPLGGEAQTYVPARDLSAISVMEVVDAMRSAHEDDLPASAAALAEPKVDGLMDRFEGAIREVANATSIRDLIIES